jgi:hypothetical protein
MLSQSKTLPLLKANSFKFRNKIYVYGFEKGKSELQFKVYKSDLELNKVDSVIVSIGKENTETYLEISADTLHNYLNFYFQKSNNKNLATLVRLNDSLRLIAKVDEFESNKINSLTTFENEIYTYNNTTYTIRTSEDSLGKQFYLSRYDVLSDKKPFEYKFIWQYPLEKRNINTTHVFFANETVLFIYVNIISGDKKGQWVLKLDAKNGTVIKGIKLNGKNDLRTYLYSNYHYDNKSKQLLVAGNIYNDEQINLEENKYAFVNLNKQNTYFFTSIDSLCENIKRHEKTVPFVNAVPKAASKEVVFYHVKIKEIIKNSDSDYSAYCSLYKSNGTDLLFLYETGFYINCILNETDVEFYADKIQYGLTSLPALVTNDLKDLNGKLEVKSVRELDKLFYKWPITDVEKHFGKDDLKNPKWIFVSTDINSAKKTFYKVTIGKKGPEHKVLLENSKYNHPEIYRTNNEKIILFNTNPEQSGFTLSLANWY